MLGRVHEHCNGADRGEFVVVVNNEAEAEGMWQLSDGSWPLDVSGFRV